MKMVSVVRSLFPGAIWVLYEILTVRNLMGLLMGSWRFGFSGERYLSYVSKQALFNPFIRVVENTFWPFERMSRSFLLAVSAPDGDRALGIFLYHVLNAVVLDVIVGGAFWFLLVLLISRALIPGSKKPRS